MRDLYDELDQEIRFNLSDQAHGAMAQQLAPEAYHQLRRARAHWFNRLLQFNNQLLAQYHKELNHEQIAPRPDR